MTKSNPKMRNFPIYNENISLAKTFTISWRAGVPWISALKDSMC
jgi:hypothetical protein